MGLVQKGVFYTPEIKFYAFDIYVNGHVIPTELSTTLFNRFGFLQALPLFVGTLDECMDYPNAYITTLPEKFGLPPVEDNICEGNVIKPWSEVVRFPNGERIVLKNKNDKIKEKQRAPKEPREGKVHPEGWLEAMDTLSEYITENRLHNVLSKIGPVTTKDFGKILGSLNKDALDDYMKENEEQWLGLPEEGQKYLSKSIGKTSSALLRNHFLNIVDGVY